jgi:hypothetical protein
VYAPTDLTADTATDMRGSRRSSPPVPVGVQRAADRAGHPSEADFRFYSEKLTCAFALPEAHRQSALVAANDQERDDQAFVDAASSNWDDDT